MRSPQIYLPGGLAIAYDVYFVNVHQSPGYERKQPQPFTHLFHKLTAS
jgi:hypothetical protein